MLIIFSHFLDYIFNAFASRSSGFGSVSEELDLESRCYQCQAMIKPYEVIPKRKDIKIKTKKRHSCSGCHGMCSYIYIIYKKIFLYYN